MIVTRDRAESFALRAFAAAGRAKKEKSVISHHANVVYTAAPLRQTSIVIPNEFERSLGLTLRFFYGIASIPLRLRSR